jgi:hypothetical protein
MGTVASLKPRSAHPYHHAAYVRIAGEGRLSHIASVTLYERFIGDKAVMPRVGMKLIMRCLVRVGEPALTTGEITCGHCAPDAARYPELDVTAEMLAEACV